MHPRTVNPLDPRSPYPSHRSPVLARNVVATSQPLAAQVGLDAMRDGGTAVDAALAAAVALTVVEPTSNGIGGDLFALVWDGHELHGLNASGPSPAGLDVSRFEGLDAMPLHGWDAVTVPGQVAGWVELAHRFGRLPLERLVAPAVAYARDGHPVGPMTAEAWARAARAFDGMDDFAAAFLPGGRPPEVGEIFRSPEHAATLEAIATTGGDAFYRGDLARRIARHAANAGAPLREDDLDAYRPAWVRPLRQPYHELELVELPPNGQGLIASIALGILQHLDLASHAPDSADAAHLQIEALKLAFADGHRHIADPASMDVEPERLLDPAYLEERARLVDPSRATRVDAGRLQPGGTVLVTTADANGRMVSLIQSNYQGFGSGVVVPGTGIALQNRGAGFAVEPGHPNRVAPGKRPFHTIIPGFLMQNGAPLAAFGVMGGHVQAQGHVQLVVRMRDFGQNPQAAIDAPRWHLNEEGEVVVERDLSLDVVEDLRRRGHVVRIDDPDAPAFFGGAQLVMRAGDAFLGASDGRREGQAVGF